tara:strand:+ start:544 stop:1620 length:1077 start_codon:yes stop_codon:yes gene_type:complete
MTAFKLKNLDMRMATDDDKHLLAYDHTKLSNINTCPTWGILRYSLHKKMPGSSRSMALEAGAAAHEGFAAVRWYQYHSRQVQNKAQARLAEKEGIRIFGPDRFDKMRATLNPKHTDRTNLINFVLESLYSYGFYDDPSDTKRTVTNISEGLICYIDAYNMEKHPIYENENRIGVEIPFDIVVTIDWLEGSEGYTTEHQTKARFTGKLDGLQYDRGKLMICEDKTGSRLDDSWLAQWVLSHQITGYCLAGATFTGEDCFKAQVTGMKIPIARNPIDTIRKEKVNRRPDPFIEEWTRWFVHSVAIDQKYRDDLNNAPMYTHSCNRYFSSCSFVPYCVADIDERAQILEEMETDEWSPLHE